MNTQEKLQRIKAKCEELIHRFPPCESVSGWQSTVAAIDLCTANLHNQYGDICDNDGMGCGACDHTEKLQGLIIESWPEELL